MGATAAVLDPEAVRFESASDSLREGYPGGDVFEWIALAITELGEDPAIILILAVLFWLVDRENVAMVAAVVATGAGFMLLLKTGFAIPRPPEAVWLVARDYDPYGVPSGHAFNAVILYGGLLYVWDRWREPRWAVGGLALIVGISVSRIVLGFHYLGDIVAGVLVGIVFLWLLDVITARDPFRCFTVGFLFAILAVLLSDDVIGLIALGACVGGMIGTYRLDEIPDVDSQSRFEAAVLTVGGLAFLVAVVLVQSTVAPESDVAIVLAHTAIIAGVLLGPFASRELDALRVDRTGGGEPTA